MNKRLSVALLLFCGTVLGFASTEYSIQSPNGKLKMKLTTGERTQYEVWCNNQQLIASSPIGLHLSDGTVVGNATVTSVKRDAVNGTIHVPFGKNNEIKEAYNQLTLSYGKDYDLVVRAYDEGVAYRFVTHWDKEIIINDEDAVFNFAFTPKIYFPECDNYSLEERDQAGNVHRIHQGYRNFERLYKIYNSPSEITDSRFSVSPVLFEYVGTPYKLVITESDTYDYPGLYMESNGYNSMRGKWARYPKEVMDGNADESKRWYSNHLVISREDYIANTWGNRNYPWRVMIVSNQDKDLLNNELVYMLAEPCKLKDVSWISPGKSVWEWWHKAVLKGVDFPSGNTNLSLPMYKYYVDWASKHDFEYMTLDAGWSEEYIQELCSYAKDKGVKILVWTWASCVRENPDDWIKKMKDYGVAGAKIDFFERNDQLAMRWGREFAERLAKNKMVAIFHGCPIPVGLNRTYPNILNYEAVRGAECNFWEKTITPEYHTRFPFIRSLAGPEDYTPGGMRNVTFEDFKPIDKPNTPPMNMGTRAHILSMYVIYDQWLGYLCDSPTEYDKYPDILDFLSKVPSVWDKTIPLDAKLGEYIVTAKRKGNDWYIGGMTNWDSRDVQVYFDFLKPGVTYQAVILKDTPMSGNKPREYSCETFEVTQNTRLNVFMAKGGGFVIRLTESKKK
jgi:hypothetical protein